MATTGDVELTILDSGGTVVVPSANVYFVMGCSSAGTVGQVVASRNVNNLIATFGYGPLVEACAMIIARGGTVIAVKTTASTPGAATAIVSTALGGTSVVTVTGTPFDTYYVYVKIVKTGVVATGPIQFQVSLDAGRTFGPVIQITTQTTYPIQHTGLTLNFAAGNLVAGATFTFGCAEPVWGTGDVQAALNAFQATQYAMVGVGGSLLVGPMTGTNAQTIEGYLETLALGKIFTRLLTCGKDATDPVPYGGAGQSEAAWITARLGDSASASNAPRVLMTAGHYNMPSQIYNPSAGQPRYRRPLAFALAARQVQIPPQRHAGRVKDGGILDIVVDQTVDPMDGFIYHDERVNPGLKPARFTCAKTRVKKTGFFFDDPLLMSQAGSVFDLLPLGTVMDIGCGIVTDVGQNIINDDIRLNKNGTIFDTAARAVESDIGNALKDLMLAANMISNYSVSVNRTNNVRSEKKVKISVSLESRGYVLEADVEIGYSTGETS